MKISMAARGNAVKSAVSSGRHAITKGMRKTRSIGQDIEWWWTVNEVQISGTKNALYRAFLDSLLYNRDIRGALTLARLLRQGVQQGADPLATGLQLLG